MRYDISRTLFDNTLNDDVVLIVFILPWKDIFFNLVRSITDSLDNSKYIFAVPSAPVIPVTNANRKEYALRWARVWCFLECKEGYPIVYY